MGFNPLVFFTGLALTFVTLCIAGFIQERWIPYKGVGVRLILTSIIYFILWFIIIVIWMQVKSPS